MKRFLIAATLLFALLTACSRENTPPDTQPVTPVPATTVVDVNGGGLQTAITASNGFGLGFLVRNETGRRLYYNDDFRLDSQPMTEAHNRWGVQYINHGDTQVKSVQWGGPRPTGIYTFERDFFTDENLTELYATVTIEFDVISWQHFADGAEPAPAHIQAHRDNREREHLAFLFAGGTSEVIVLASEVAVSRTEVAFSTANVSTQSFMHGLHYSLLVYENGWKPAPTILDSWAISDIGIGIRGGQVIEDRFDFEWLYGVLPNGRYMIMRHHCEDHFRAGAARVQETLMVEFVIDDNTPERLP